MRAAVPGKQAYSTPALRSLRTKGRKGWSKLIPAHCEAAKQQTHILKLYHSASASSTTVYSREAIPFQTRAEIPFKTL